MEVDEDMTSICESTVSIKVFELENMEKILQILCNGYRNSFAKKRVFDAAPQL